MVKVDSPVVCISAGKVAVGYRTSPSLKGPPHHELLDSKRASPSVVNGPQGPSSMISTSSLLRALLVPVLLTRVYPPARPFLFMAFASWASWANEHSLSSISKSNFPNLLACVPGAATQTHFIPGRNPSSNNGQQRPVRSHFQPKRFGSESRDGRRLFFFFRESQLSFSTNARP